MEKHQSVSTSQYQNILSAWQEGITDAARSPELMRRVERHRGKLLPRFAEHYTKLRALPRRVRRAVQRKWKHTLAGVAILMALGVGPASATVFNVPCPGGVGDNAALIQAINNANNEVANPGADTINLVANCAHTLTAVNTYYSYFGPNGLPVITSEIVIDGNGSTIMRMSGSDDFRIFAINSSGNLTLQETTVSGGKTSGNFEGGGGVLNRGTLSITDSTITGNSTSGTSSGGGGVVNFGGTLTLTRTLISGNTATLSSADEVSSIPSVTNNTYNLFGHSGISTADALFGVTPGATDITATSDGTMPTALASILDTTLASNGGPTQTHALITDSPAIDAAGMTCSATDQRGFFRPADGDGSNTAECDIGSFEFASAPLCDGFIATIFGTEGNNVLNGTNKPDVIAGLGGNDTINGRNGEDIICGGEGSDTISGGNGIDELFGDAGNDTLVTEAGELIPEQAASRLRVSLSGALRLGLPITL